MIKSLFKTQGIAKGATEERKEAAAAQPEISVQFEDLSTQKDLLGTPRGLKGCSKIEFSPDLEEKTQLSPGRDSSWVSQEH